MTGSTQVRLALRAIRTARTHLRSAREYARATKRDGEVLDLLTRLHLEELAALGLLDSLGLTESRRRIETRKHLDKPSRKK